MFNKNINIKKTTEYSNNFCNLDLFCLIIIFKLNLLITYILIFLLYILKYLSKKSKKINNYKSQDNKKIYYNNYNVNFISFNDIIENLLHLNYFAIIVIIKYLLFTNILEMTINDFR